MNTKPFSYISRNIVEISKSVPQWTERFPDTSPPERVLQIIANLMVNIPFAAFDGTSPQKNV